MLYSWPGVFLVSLVLQAAAERCTTPNNEQGECVSLYYSCPILLDALATKQNASIELVRKSNCGGSVVDPMVCCGSSSATAVRENKTSVHDGGNRKTNNLLPDRSYCGYTGIDEFPWSAGLLYKFNNKTQIDCGGSLITNKYVLTSAYCVTDRSSISLIGVRLGEHNITTEKNCIENSQFDDCTDPVEDFDVEKIITHPMFNLRTKTADIALLRLNRTVTYSDFIRPICLPTPGTKFSKIGDTLTRVDWGLFNLPDEIYTKRKILTKLISNDECAAFGNPVTENNFCTKTLETSNACNDAGGPVLFSFKSQWHLEGIASLSIGCIFNETADVHTKVANYLDWIQKNIEP